MIREGGPGLRRSHVVGVGKDDTPHDFFFTTTRTNAASLPLLAQKVGQEDVAQKVGQEDVGKISREATL
jgi:hypothetical protein